jgi:hypothetical protein
MNSSANIEIENPAAPDQSVAALRWLHSSHAVSGAQKARASGTKG